MKGFSIIITVKDHYELLRQLIESIQHWALSYNQIIIVDDYSAHGELRAYEEYLNTQPKIEVIMHQEHRHAHFYHHKRFLNKEISDDFDYRDYDSVKPSKGHMLSLLAGIRRNQSEFIYEVDCDCILLKNSAGMFKEMTELFYSHPNAMLIGDVHYVKSFETMEFNTRGKERIFGDGSTISTRGVVNGAAGALRVAGWEKHGLRILPHYYKRQQYKQKVSGVVFGQFNQDIFDKGFSTIHYPVHGMKKVLHLGNAVIKKPYGPGGKATFMFCKGFGRKYGSRISEDILEDWRAGRYYVDMAHDDYVKYLKEKYCGKPFDQVQPMIDENILKPVDQDFPEWKE